MTAPLGTCSPHKMRSTIRAFVPTSATGAVPAARARLVSYNILADELCMTEKHSYCPVKDREWRGDSGRGARLVEELLSYEADIVCLQECSLRKFDDCFHTGLGKEFTGFHHSAHLSTRRAAAEARMSVTGLATFVRSAAWKPVNVQAVRLGEDSDARGHIGSLQQTLRARDESVLLVLLEHVASGARLAVGNTHLHWDPRQPHVKSSQAELAARGLAAFASVRPAGAPSTEASAAASCPIALVGDFNSVPHLQPSFLPSAQRAALPELLPVEWQASAVYRLLSNGNVESTHPEHPTAFRAGQAASKEAAKEDAAATAAAAAAARTVAPSFAKAAAAAAAPCVEPASSLEPPSKRSRNAQKRPHHSNASEASGGTQCNLGALTTGVPLRDAYWGALAPGPLPLTTHADDFAGCLDYCWISPAIEVMEVLAMPYELNAPVVFGKIPSAEFPSDHLAIACTLAVPIGAAL